MKLNAKNILIDIGFLIKIKLIKEFQFQFLKKF